MHVHHHTIIVTNGAAQRMWSVGKKRPIDCFGTDCAFKYVRLKILFDRHFLRRKNNLILIAQNVRECVFHMPSIGIPTKFYSSPLWYVFVKHLIDRLVICFSFRASSILFINSITAAWHIPLPNNIYHFWCASIFTRSTTPPRALYLSVYLRFLYVLKTWDLTLVPNCAFTFLSAFRTFSVSVYLSVSNFFAICIIFCSCRSLIFGWVRVS